jgi:hypothetical protein
VWDLPVSSVTSAWRPARQISKKPGLAAPRSGGWSAAGGGLHPKHPPAGLLVGGSWPGPRCCPWEPPPVRRPRP